MTLKVIKVDEDRNPVIKSGKLVFVYAAEAAAQTIACAIRTQLKEYRYDQKRGIEYLNNAFLGNPNYQQFEFQIRQLVKSLAFVEKITNFNYTIDNSVLNYNLTVKTIYGDVTVSE